MNEDKVKGSILGLALGDALGAAWEGGEPAQTARQDIGAGKDKCRWTDDTQMSIDIMESLIRCGKLNQDDMARRFAESFEWSRGYGPGAASILQMIKKGMPWQEANRSVYPDGSYGNGAAMRVAPVGLFFVNHTADVLVAAATKTALITHAHPLGVEGAVMIALATSLAAKDAESPAIMDQLGEAAHQEAFRARIALAQRWIGDDKPREAGDVRQGLGNGVAAHHSAVTAVYSALAHRNLTFEELLHYVRSLGGDVDTIGAMAGAIWGASRGIVALSDELLQKVEQRDYLEALAVRFFRKIMA